MKKIETYLPELSKEQLAQIEKLGILYKEWNQKVNLVSRKDIDNIYSHHILHCFAIAKFIQFNPGCKVLDLGTGGGLPGIPLAIFFPEVSFTLIDARRKKITVVNDIIDQLKLTNVNGYHLRAEECNQKFDFIVSRAVAKIETLRNWSYPLIKRKYLHALPNGLITLKGGDLKNEFKELPKKAYHEKIPIQDYFKEAHFEEKFLIYLQL